MSTPPESIPDDPKTALESFLTRLNRDYYPWYDRSVRTHYWISLPIELVALFSGFATAILAALATQEALSHFGFIRILLVLLPALGGAASTIAVQSRLYERYQLREDGRRGIQAILNEGRARYAAVTTPEQYSAIHYELAQRVDRIEAEQSANFFSLAVNRTESVRQNQHDEV